MPLRRHRKIQRGRSVAEVAGQERGLLACSSSCPPYVGASVLRQSRRLHRMKGAKMNVHTCSQQGRTSSLAAVHSALLGQILLHAPVLGPRRTTAQWPIRAWSLAGSPRSPRSLCCQTPVRVITTSLRLEESGGPTPSTPSTHRADIRRNPHIFGKEAHRRPTVTHVQNQLPSNYWRIWQGCRTYTIPSGSGVRTPSPQRPCSVSSAARLHSCAGWTSPERR